MLMNAANFALASQSSRASMDGGFWYVYMLRSIAAPGRYYVGMTEDLRERLHRHNADLVPHTSKFDPWQLETAIAFRSKEKAVAFEKYLKSHSGRAFAKRHF
jgi:predicted GIY-YIG superfamily endonuclease